MHSRARPRHSSGGSQTPMHRSRSPAQRRQFRTPVMADRGATPIAKGEAPPAHAERSLPSGAAPALPLVSMNPIARTSPPLIARKADSAERLPVVGALPVTTASPTAASTSAQLVLRKPIVTAAPSQSPAPPTITPSPHNVIARTANETAPESVGQRSHAPYTHSHDIDIDSLAEEVGNRLARRLEIERERMGVRQWRQVS